MHYKHYILHARAHMKLFIKSRDINFQEIVIVLYICKEAYTRKKDKIFVFCVCWCLFPPITVTAAVSSTILLCIVVKHLRPIFCLFFLSLFWSPLTYDDVEL